MRLLLAGLILAGLIRQAELLLCDPACASDEYCDTVDGNFKCLCNITIYSGANDRSLTPVLTCNSSAMTISVSTCLLVALHRYPELSYLLNTSCDSGYSTVLNGMRMHSMQILPQNKSCGNVMQKDDASVTYWNVLHIPGDVSTGILNVPFSCTYTPNMQDSVPNVLFPTGSAIDLAFQDTGPVPTTMTCYLDESYTVPISGQQLEVAVGKILYFGIRTQFEDSPTYVLRAETCFATPKPDPNSLQKMMLITGGCPAEENFLTTVDANGLSLEVRFTLSVFAFQGFSELHIYCDVRLCGQTATQSCTGCTSLKSGELGEGSGRLRLGPIPIAAYDTTSSGYRTAMYWPVLWSTLIALLCIRPL